MGALEEVSTLAPVVEQTNPEESSTSEAATETREPGEIAEQTSG